jgi:aminopeptidase
MYEDFAPKLARVITEYSQPVHHNDVVMIAASQDTIQLVQALYEAVLRQGGHPYVIGGIPGLNDLKMRIADEHQLTHINPIMDKMLDEIDIYYNIMASSNTKAMSGFPPEKIALMQKANKPIIEKYFARVASGELRWCIMPWPTQADAQEAEMSLLDWTQFIYEACNLHLEDPVAHWKSVRNEQDRLVQYLSDKSEAHVKGPGIDLKFNFQERLWVNCAGTVNFPDGEIFTGPVEGSVNGFVDFNMRTVYGGREVNGVHFEFKDGEIVDASANKNEEWLMSQLDLDEGARRLGEFAIGTNWEIQHVTGNTLYDEKIGGTIHMAVGRSIPESKGENMSSVHWDMVHDMKDGGEIYIDGELFYRSGEFQV